MSYRVPREGDYVILESRRSNALGRENGIDMVDNVGFFRGWIRVSDITQAVVGSKYRIIQVKGLNGLLEVVSVIEGCLKLLLPTSSMY